jgi:hypothetical protein
MYALMEQFLDIIVDVEVIDKRETGGASTNMEVLGLQRILERIAGNIVTSELVTDASAAVIAMVRYYKTLQVFFHVLVDRLWTILNRNEKLTH